MEKERKPYELRTSDFIPGIGLYRHHKRSMKDAPTEYLERSLHNEEYDKRADLLEKYQLGAGVGILGSGTAGLVGLLCLL